MKQSDIFGVKYIHQRDAGVRYLRQRGRLWSDQKVNKVGSLPWRREREREHAVPIPAFLLR